MSETDRTMPLSRASLARIEGRNWLIEGRPTTKCPSEGCRAVDAMRLIGEEIVLDGDPGAQPGDLRDHLDGARGPADDRREPPSQLHRPRRVPAARPRSSSAASGCSANLFNAPGETTGARTQGSSEAIMLGALSLKWKWRQRREAAGKPTDEPEPRLRRRRPRRLGEVLPLLRRRAADRAAAARQVHDRPRGRGAARRREHDRGRRRPRHDVHRPHRRHRRDQRPAGRGQGREGPRRPAAHRRRQRRLRLAVPLPDSKWDFRLEQVRSINVSGHKFGLVYPGIGWLIFREKADLAQDLVFYENYLGKTDATFTLNFSTGSAMVLAQYYNLVRFGHEGYTDMMEMMEKNSQYLAERLAESASSS